MKAIYEYNNYKDFLTDKICSYPNRGRGISSKLSKYIGVSAVMVSQVLKGNRNFSRDKMFLTTMFFEMNAVETEYLLHMFDLNQSKSLEHVNYLHRQLDKVRRRIKETEEEIFSISEAMPQDETTVWIAQGMEKTAN